MLIAEFSAAIERREPFEIENITASNTVDTVARGNAFAGSAANHDNEMIEATRNALMGNTDVVSSIGGAAMRLSAQFTEIARKRENRAAQDRQLYMQVMMNRMLEDFDTRIEAVNNEIYLLDSAIKDPNHVLWHAQDVTDLEQTDLDILTLIQKEKDITVEDFMRLDAKERRDLAIEVLEQKEEYRQELVTAREKHIELMEHSENIDVFVEPYPVENNRFLDNDMEMAAKALEEKESVVFDRHNITPANMDSLYDQIKLMEHEQNTGKIELENYAGLESSLSHKASINLSFG